MQNAFASALRMNFAPIYPLLPISSTAFVSALYCGFRSVWSQRADWAYFKGFYARTLASDGAGVVVVGGVFANVCTYVLYVCMYTCMHACTCVHICVCVHVCVCMWMHACIHTTMHAFTYTRMCTVHAHTYMMQNVLVCGGSSRFSHMYIYV